MTFVHFRHKVVVSECYLCGPDQPIVFTKNTLHTTQDTSLYSKKNVTRRVLKYWSKGEQSRGIHKDNTRVRNKGVKKSTAELSTREEYKEQ